MFSEDEPQGLLVVALIGLAFIVARVAADRHRARCSAPLLPGAVRRVVSGRSRSRALCVRAVRDRRRSGIAVAADRTVRAFGRDAAVDRARRRGVALLAVAARARRRARARTSVARARQHGRGATRRAASRRATRDGAVVVAPVGLGDAARVPCVRRRRDRKPRIVVCALPQRLRRRVRRVVRTTASSRSSPTARRSRLPTRAPGGTPVYEIARAWTSTLRRCRAIDRALAREGARSPTTSLLAGLFGAIAALVCRARAASRRTTTTCCSPTRCCTGTLWIDALWRDASIDAVLFHGHRYIVNDPVPAVLMLPLVALFGLAANQTLLACLLCGVATGAAWALLERLGVVDRTTLWLVVFFSPARICCGARCWATCGSSRRRRPSRSRCSRCASSPGKRRGWLVAMWMALALGSRFTLVMALPVVLWWVWRRISRRENVRPRSALAFVVDADPVLRCSGSRTISARWHVPWDAGHTIFYHQDPYMGSTSGSPFALANVPMELFSFFVVPPGVPRGLSVRRAARVRDRAVVHQPGAACWRSSRASRGGWSISLWLATVLMAGPSLLYYANGGSQFGMRHALDFAPFVLVADGARGAHGRAVSGVGRKSSSCGASRWARTASGTGTRSLRNGT